MFTSKVLNEFNGEVFKFKNYFNFVILLYN